MGGIWFIMQLILPVIKLPMQRHMPLKYVGKKLHKGKDSISAALRYGSGSGENLAHLWYFSH